MKTIIGILFFLMGCIGISQYWNKFAVGSCMAVAGIMFAWSFIDWLRKRKARSE